MYSFATLARAHGEPLGHGRLKQHNEDFVVDELMPVLPSGTGEHLWLQIRKTGCNTDWLARQLADVAGIKPMAVSYAGLKDRHAVTSQWFSLHLPGCEDPDLSSLESDDIHILQAIRHDRKLKRGTLSGNHFRILVRGLSISDQQVEEKLTSIIEQGVPNYFGAQRFGHGMNNLLKAEALFAGQLKRVKKSQRSIYLSAARSWVFNQVLSERVQRGNWDQYLLGDVFQLTGKSACFADDNSNDIEQRLADHSIHPTGPLWGKGISMAKGACLELEDAVAEHNRQLCQGLVDCGMKQERRALRLLVAKLAWQLAGDETLELSFELPAGAYATMVLREIIDFVDV